MGDIVKQMMGQGRASVGQRAPTSTLDILSSVSPSPIGAADAELPEQAKEDIVVEGFAPTKRNLLGKIADGVLMAYGQEPIYEGRMKERDFGRASRNFMDDPEEAIRRIGMVDPEAGWKLRGEYMDDRRADVTAEKEELEKQRMIRERISSLLYGVNDQNADRLLPVVRQYAAKHGITDLPEEYDPDTISMWRLGGLKPDDIEDNSRDTQYKNERLRQMEEGLDLRERSIEDTNAYRSERLQDFDQERERKARGRPPKQGPKPVMTRLGPGEVSPDGNQIRVKVGDNEYHRYARTNKNSEWFRVE